MIGVLPFIQPILKQYASGMHKCIPYAKSGALPLDEPGCLSERAEGLNPFPTQNTTFFDSITPVVYDQGGMHKCIPYETSRQIPISLSAAAKNIDKS